VAVEKPKRWTTASDLLDITDAVIVAGHLGHASTNTTVKYDRRGERARKKAAQELHIPYIRRD
jgi:integrase